MSATQLTAAAGALVRSITFSRNASGVLVGAKIVSTDNTAAQIGTQTSDNKTIAFGNNETVESMNIWQSSTAVGRIWITTSTGQTFDFGVETDDMDQLDVEVFSGYLYGITCVLGKGDVMSGLEAWFLQELDGGFASNIGGGGYSEIITYDTIQVIDFDAVDYEVLIISDDADNLQIEDGEEVILETEETEEIYEETEETVVEETYETYEEDAYVANEVEEEGEEIEEEVDVEIETEQTEVEVEVEEEVTEVDVEVYEEEE